MTCKYAANLLLFTRGCRGIPRWNCFETMRSRFLFPRRGKKPAGRQRKNVPSDFQKCFRIFFFFFIFICCVSSKILALRVSIVIFFFFLCDILTFSHSGIKLITFLKFLIFKIWNWNYSINFSMFLNFSFYLKNNSYKKSTLCILFRNINLIFFISNIHLEEFVSKYYLCSLRK